MAAIYLRHSVHGEKVACSEAEAIYDESHGWTRFTVPDPRAGTPDRVDVAAVVDETTQEDVTYVVTATNGMQPSNAMPKPRRRRSAVNADSQ